MNKSLNYLLWTLLSHLASFLTISLPLSLCSSYWQPFISWATLPSFRLSTFHKMVYISRITTAFPSFSHLTITDTSCFKSARLFWWSFPWCPTCQGWVWCLSIYLHRSLYLPKESPDYLSFFPMVHILHGTGTVLKWFTRILYTQQVPKVYSKCSITI